MSEQQGDEGSSFKLEARPAEKKTIEDWATEEGMLPENLERPTGARLGRFQVPSRTQNPKYVLFVQAKALRGWPEGAEVTKADFDEAVKEAQAIESR